MKNTLESEVKKGILLPAVLASAIVNDVVDRGRRGKAMLGSNLATQIGVGEPRRHGRARGARGARRAGGSNGSARVRRVGHRRRHMHVSAMALVARAARNRPRIARHRATGHAAAVAYGGARPVAAGPAAVACGGARARARAGVAAGTARRERAVARPTAGTPVCAARSGVLAQNDAAAAQLLAIELAERVSQAALVNKLNDALPGTQLVCVGKRHFASAAGKVLEIL
ncbi:hypothetical protein BX661DRAFT_185429 [Kickxella alabastrina]|uniref:uncharacterized protein n=1 Tax=Kickxella alabastrina TaxID=61397 RepID=UPI00221F532F|nr:uncharacterized protein BX661DRAFT_185429 [Kickxella alabastrina]KAI7824495.1 hypothetical protein BX661DRAFT_185429 [Kickxella alabastrina]